MLTNSKWKKQDFTRKKVRNKQREQDTYFDLFLLRVTQGENVLESERDFPYMWW